MIKKYSHKLFTRDNRQFVLISDISIAVIFVLSIAVLCYSSFFLYVFALLDKINIPVSAKRETISVFVNDLHKYFYFIFQII